MSALRQIVCSATALHTRAFTRLRSLHQSTPATTMVMMKVISTPATPPAMALIGIPYEGPRNVEDVFEMSAKVLEVPDERAGKGVVEKAGSVPSECELDAKLVPRSTADGGTSWPGLPDAVDTRDSLAKDEGEGGW